MRTRLFGICLVFLVACGHHDTLTFRGVCQAIATADCSRQSQCSPPGQSSCVQTFVDACCSVSGGCDKEVTDPGAQAALDKCVADFKTFPCPDLANGDYPKSCQ